MEKKKKKILIIDRKPKNIELLGNELEKRGFEYFTGKDYTEIDYALSNERSFDVVIIDLTGFDSDIWDRCKIIHQRNIRFLILSLRPNTMLQKEGFLHGVSAIVSKPLLLNQFLDLLNSMINE